MRESWVSLVKWLVVLAMPFFLGFSTIRLFIANAPSYVRYEYGKANFPADLTFVDPLQQQRLRLEPLSQEQRRALALVAVDYLQRREPATETIYLLEEQRLPGGTDRLYNEAEISHMIDVKNVTDAIGRLNWLFMAVVVGGLALLLGRRQTRADGFAAIMYGGVLTTALLLFIALFILVAWNSFFVQFHELLFPPDTWTFAYTDSLIRLFPEKFWFDFGVLLSLSALSAGIVTALLGYLLRRSLALTREV